MKSCHKITGTSCLFIIDDVDWLTGDLHMNHGESSETNLFVVYLDDLQYIPAKQGSFGLEICIIIQ